MSSNPIILITGANSGIGYATVQSLSASGKPYTIILTSRSLERAEEASQKLVKELGGPKETVLVPIQLDVDDDTSIENARKFVEEKFGRLDILINNAGIALDPQLGAMPLREIYAKTFSTNVISVHVFTEAMIPLLFKSSSPRILFLSSALSSLGSHPDPTWPVNGAPPAGWPKTPVFAAPTYRTSKSAMNMMILEWERVLRNDNFKIHVIEPGFLATNLAGMGADVMRGHGAKDPIEGGNFIRSIVEGQKDDTLNVLIGKDGVIPW